MIKIATWTSLAIMLCLLACTEDDKAIYPNFVGYHVPHDTANFTLLKTISYQQTTSYTCGPSVVMSLMHHYGMLSTNEMNQKTEFRLAKEMGTTAWGTTQDNMVAWLENHGFNVQSGRGIETETLMDNLRKGIPTIIVWNDWSGHAMLVIGYYVKGTNSNGSKDVLFFADPSTSSYLVDSERTFFGVNTITTDDLEFNWFNAQYFFNPSHTAVGMYIIATPKTYRSDQ